MFQPTPQTTQIELFEPEKVTAPPKTPEVKSLFYPFHAYHLAEALKLKEIAKLFDLKPLVFNPMCLVYELSPEAFCLFYNFGSVVFFNVGEPAQKTTLERLQNFLAAKQDPIMADEFLLEVKPKSPNTVSFDKVVVDKLKKEKIELIALVLARSTALEFFEKKTDEMLSKLGGRNFIAKMGQVLTMKQELIATLGLLEKPDETWDSKTLDDLYQEAIMMFELKERFRTLDYKLKTIQENLEVLSNFASNRQHLWLEGIIVALIVIEVALFCFDLFLK